VAAGHETPGPAAAALLHGDTAEVDDVSGVTEVERVARLDYGVFGGVVGLLGGTRGDGGQDNQGINLKMHIESFGLF
jgi:hypothetical protein